MAEPLHILILEDNPADAELVQFELQEAGIIFASKVVMTEKEYVQAIQDDCPDLILSDYDLPKYNGALALAEANRRCPDTPFILVTGAVTEDRAIDILTQGAKDYVLKTRLAQRLVPAVRRALAEAEEHRARKQAETELREAHRTLTEANESLKAEIVERRRIEEELQRATQILRAISQYSPDLVYAKDTQSRLVYASESTLRVLGKSAQEAMGKTDVEFHADPRLGSAVMENDRIVRETRRPLVVEEPTCMPDGTVRVFHSTKVPWIAEDGTLMGTFGISVDIHELKRAEEALKAANETLEQRVAERVTELKAEMAVRKKAEEALQASEERYRGVVENTTAIVVRIDPGGIITFANRRALDFFGYSAEELIGKHAVGTIVPPRESSGRDLVKMVDQIAADPDAFHTNANENMCKDGRRVWLEWTNSGVHGPDGKLREFLSVGIDATERKRAEEEMRAANQELEEFNQAMVGRELRMIELKQEINAVCAQLGQPPRYPLEDEEAPR